jgi:hypothetical protein
MSGTAQYWRDWSESQLASYQGDQGSSNHCAKYAAASLLNLLYGTNADGGELVSLIEGRLLKGTGRYTILGNDNGSLVFQAANLLRRLAKMQGIYPQVRCQRINRIGLFSLLKDDKTLALVSLTYWQGKEPLISKGKYTSSSLASAHRVGGHIMIPAAYDPDHFNQAGFSTPWGFLSSWGSNDQLYWMTENDFLRTWGQLSIFNTVTVNRPED